MATSSAKIATMGAQQNANMPCDSGMAKVLVTDVLWEVLNLCAVYLSLAEEMSTCIRRTDAGDIRVQRWSVAT